MANQRLLSHLLSTRLSNQHENLISESITFILNNSRIANKAFLQYIQQRVSYPLEITVFVNQVHNPNKAIPDISGYDKNSDLRLIVESKFWAYLTTAQPVEYLNLISSNLDSVLIFLVPAKRLTTIRNELIIRCKNANIELIDATVFEDDLWMATIGNCKHLLVASWSTVLDYISEELRI